MGSNGGALGEWRGAKANEELGVENFLGYETYKVARGLGGQQPTREAELG